MYTHGCIISTDIIYLRMDTGEEARGCGVKNNAELYVNI